MSRSSLVRATAPPVAVRDDDGREVPVRPLTMRGAGQLQRWIDSLPPPRATERLKDRAAGLPAESVQPLLIAANYRDEEWPPHVGDLQDAIQVLDLLTSHPDGPRELVRAALKLDPSAADALLDRLSLGAFRRLAEAALGLAAEVWLQDEVRRLAVMAAEAGEHPVARGLEELADRTWGTPPGEGADPKGDGGAGATPSTGAIFTSSAPASSAGR
jgi:hypothetical protein